MFVALLVALAVGAIVALASATDRRLRVADEPRFAALVCMSGAVAGWALVDTITGLSTDSFDAWDVIGATLGALSIAAVARHGRRRTFSEMGLTAHSE